jgi:adenylate cyclase
MPPDDAPLDRDEQAWIEAGLLEPEADSADDRRALLRYLTECGATLDDLRAANEEQRLRFVPAGLLRRAEHTRTAREIADEAGVDVERVLQMSRVAGLPIPDPDERAYREQDVVAVQLLVGAMELFGERAAIEFTRSIGSGLALIADSALALFGINVASQFDERGVSELEQARVSTFAALALTQEVPKVLETLLFHHVEAASQRSLASAPIAGRTARLAVAFVDIVQSTAMVQRLDPEPLADAIGAFEQEATELVGSRGGRVVKTLGDEVMFVVADPVAACDAALALRDHAATDDRLPDVRGAVAFGDLVRGYGDFYGREVTMAARAVKVADPGAIIATAAVRDAVDAEEAGGFDLTSLGSHALRGFDDPVELFELERA